MPTYQRSVLGHLGLRGIPGTIFSCAGCWTYGNANRKLASALPVQMTYKALVESFTDCKDARRAAWVLDEMQEMLVRMYA